MLVSKTKMFLDLSRKTSYVNSKFHEQLSWIIGPNLIASSSEHFAQS